MSGQRTLLINPPPINGVRFTRQGRCQEREEVLGTTKPPFSLLVCASLMRQRGLDFRFVDQSASGLGFNAARSGINWLILLRMWS